MYCWQLEEEGRSGKLSDQSEVCFINSVAVSNSANCMGTLSTVIEALSFAVYFVQRSLFPSPAPAKYQYTQLPSKAKTNSCWSVVVQFSGSVMLN